VHESLVRAPGDRSSPIENRLAWPHADRPAIYDDLDLATAAGAVVGAERLGRVAPDSLVDEDARPAHPTPDELLSQPTGGVADPGDPDELEPRLRGEPTPSTTDRSLRRGIGHWSSSA